jgi:hypothetical protein
VFLLSTDGALVELRKVVRHQHEQECLHDASERVGVSITPPVRLSMVHLASFVLMRAVPNVRAHRAVNDALLCRLIDPSAVRVSWAVSGSNDRQCATLHTAKCSQHVP